MKKLRFAFQIVLIHKKIQLFLQYWLIFHKKNFVLPTGWPVTNSFEAITMHNDITLPYLIRFKKSNEVFFLLFSTKGFYTVQKKSQSRALQEKNVAFFFSNKKEMLQSFVRVSGTSTISGVIVLLQARVLFPPCFSRRV